MKNMDSYLKEMFAFQKFDTTNTMYDLTDKVLAKYGLDDEDELMLSFDDLASVAAGVTIEQTDHEDEKGAPNT